MQNWCRQFWNQTQLLACEDYLAKMTDEKNEVAAAKARNLMDQLDGTDGEFNNGVSVDAAFFCIVVEKAPNASR